MNMKKFFKNILAFALTITAVASCVDDRNNFLPEDSFGFNKTAGENVVTLPIYGGSYDIAVIKSGKGLNAGVVDITTSNADLLAFNKQYGTDYISVMPTNLYGPNDNYHPTHSHVLPALIRRFHEAKEAGQAHTHTHQHKLTHNLTQ